MDCRLGFFFLLIVAGEFIVCSSGSKNTSKKRPFTLTSSEYSKHFVTLLPRHNNLIGTLYCLAPTPVHISYFNPDPLGITSKNQGLTLLCSRVRPCVNGGDVPHFKF